jgi:MFS family permease
MRLAFFIAAACAGANALLASRVLPSIAPTAGSATRRFDPGGWRLILPCLAVAFVLTYAFSGIEATFALFTKDALAFEPADNGWLFGGMALVAALFQAFGTARLAQRVGEARRVALGLAVLGLGIGTIPFADSIALLLPPVALLAIGHAIVAPSLAAWVSRRAPADRQGELLGLTQSTSALARVAGPGVGGLLFDHVGRGAPFYTAAVLIAGVAIAAVAAKTS